MFAYVYIGALLLGAVTTWWLAATKFLPSLWLRLFYALLGLLSGLYGVYQIKTVLIEGAPLQLGVIILPFLLPAISSYLLWKGYRGRGGRAASNPDRA